MMNTKQYIPEVYRKERDMQVFTSLLDIILSFCKYRIDHLGDVYDAYKCPEQFLPYLAKTLNYDYNFNDTVTSNRRIIDTFAIMERNKGSEIGIRMATALSLTSMSASQDNDELIDIASDYIEILNNIRIAINYEDGIIQIDYPNIYNLVRYLLDYVRPVGMLIDLRSVVSTEVHREAMLVYATIQNNTVPYDPRIKTAIEKSFINFSGYAMQDWIDYVNGDDEQVRELVIDLGGGEE
jgi:phage tail-like protein